MGNSLPIGARLKEERDRLGLNQGAFADLAGLTRKTLFGYESDIRAPDAMALAAWSAVGLDVLYVLTGRRHGPIGPTLGPRERALLDNYRHSGEEGKRAVEVAASAFARQEGEPRKVQNGQ